MQFKLVSKFKTIGDQAQAVKKLAFGIVKGKKDQVLLGVTGSGKTFTIANVIEQIQRPTLVISHNKTLAAQLYQEFREFFPQNAVSYFVSYYDYYQPEAYIPQTDTYIEKETQINQEIDKLRLSTTTNLLTRKDTLVVASVSCIYNLGSPVEYGRFILELDEKAKISRQSIIERLSDLQYERDDFGFHRSTFRVRGDVIEVFLASEDFAIRLILTINSIGKIEKVNPLTGNVVERLSKTVIYPAKHYMTNPKTYHQVFGQIRQDLAIRVKELKLQKKDLEAKRLETRTNFDLQMINELGFVNGIENYSRYFDGRAPGQPPFTLLEHFEKAADDWLLIIDESHMTIPQIRGMYNGDRSRKEMLIEHGFRLPAALDNRPLKFDEFMRRVHQTIFVSATPNPWEISLAGNDGLSQQLIRPTGLLDPQVEIRKTRGQVDDLISEIKKRTKKGERTLVTTLTKRMAEDLASYLEEQDIKVQYLHADIQTFDRQDILDELRLGNCDVVVGINLLREGLDLPEVSLVAILDADREGFLRSETSLVQTMGRAARHVNAKVILYADTVTGSMKRAIDEVTRRRKIQLKYNKKHHIKPQSIHKPIREKLVEREEKIKETIGLLIKQTEKEYLLPEEREELIKKLRKQMHEAARMLDFETAALLRDQIKLVRSASLKH